LGKFEPTHVGCYWKNLPASFLWTTRFTRRKVESAKRAARIQIFSGLCLLTDYPNASGVVDGDVVRAIAYPNGDYSYTAVSGGSKTVRQFTCDINDVSRMPTQIELNQMKEAKPREP